MPSTTKGREFPHPKTREVVLSYLLGRGHKDVAREHDIPYTTCVGIFQKYVKLVPVLIKALPEEQHKLPLGDA